MEEAGGTEGSAAVKAAWRSWANNVLLAALILISCGFTYSFAWTNGAKEGMAIGWNMAVQQCRLNMAICKRTDEK